MVNVSVRVSVRHLILNAELHSVGNDSPPNMTGGYVAASIDDVRRMMYVV